jgi:ABC-2 type transport system ATP-binding protein
LIAPTGGSVEILGQEVRSHRSQVLPRVGALVESPALYGYLSGRDNLRAVGNLLGGASEKRIDEVLEIVSLKGRDRDRVKTYSLGMKQRLGLALALLNDPDLLILDEPANGLDPEGVHWLRQYLRAFADAGGTVLISSHVLAEVAQTVDDVVIIAHGRLVTQSSLADLARRRQTGVRVRTPQAEALRSALIGQGIAAELVASDVVMAFDTTTDAVGLTAAGVNAVIYEMAHEQFDLEELFLELTTPEGAVA